MKLIKDLLVQTAKVNKEECLNVKLTRIGHPPLSFNYILSKRILDSKDDKFQNSKYEVFFLQND